VTAGGTAESTGTGDASTGRSDGGTGDERGTGEDGGAAVERTTVRITDEVGEILGVDQREYRLGADDVVTLPTANAEPLLDREAAERLD
jgi:DNA replication factor GINS